MTESEKFYERTLIMLDREQIERVSLSIPRGLVRGFDKLVEERGFESRSQAVSELFARELDSHSSQEGSKIMTGTITLVYSHSKGDLKRKLADLQYEYVNEVISSLHVLLENHHTLEVVLVQGRARKLRHIANRLITCKGVKSGTMTLSASLMPPLQYPSQKEESAFV